MEVPCYTSTASDKVRFTEHHRGWIRFIDRNVPITQLAKTAVSSYGRFWEEYKGLECNNGAIKCSSSRLATQFCRRKCIDVKQNFIIYMLHENELYLVKLETKQILCHFLFKLLDFIPFQCKNNNETLLWITNIRSIDKYKKQDDSLVIKANVKVMKKYEPRSFQDESVQPRKGCGYYCINIPVHWLH